MTTAIIDYGSGNLRSAEKAFQRMAAETGGGAVIVTSDPDVVARADRVVLPGVGAFADCRRGLMAVGGMAEAIEARVADGYPFLGICVGMQLMATRGLEHGETPGFGWIPGEVERLAPNDPELKVPHMGWNELVITAEHPVLAGIEAGAHAYFVHSYHLRVRVPEHRLAHVHYGQMVTAVVGRANMVGTQFHPEKSQATGLRLIANFLNWRP
ncbi:imidazole glycerol phosphate synthase subunit HisH [Limibaculum sp. M0105]|uniref:Imidazole glycerol phosphate synthase subunit HisH n=1 Tax=Thermohalobaculum xanthum TaxID=2753746 RepID=A0A8J7M8G2_9RHOB|nr:imidazole glycerol phosphate synthase subunit HisH [Thermohalobaculum xanthum]MBK0400496.1 imidazole glycerol phosphate synthase subunit HisH [Thermohalobaculum xanthum]